MYGLLIVLSIVLGIVGGFRSYFKHKYDLARLKSTDVLYQKAIEEPEDKPSALALLERESNRILAIQKVKTLEEENKELKSQLQSMEKHPQQTKLVEVQLQSCREEVLKLKREKTLLGQTNEKLILKIQNQLTAPNWQTLNHEIAKISLEMSPSISIPFQSMVLCWHTVVRYDTGDEDRDKALQEGLQFAQELDLQLDRRQDPRTIIVKKFSETFEM